MAKKRRMTEGKQNIVQNKAGTAPPNDDFKPCVMWHLDSYPQSKEAILTSDGFVLVHVSEKIEIEDGNIVEPTKIIEGLYYYPPEIGTSYFILGMDKNLIPFSVEGKWGYCDTNSGKVVFEPQWDFCDEFHGDYARFGIDGEFHEKNLDFYGRFGCIDFRGNIIIEPKYENLSYLHGRCICSFKARIGGFWGVIDINEGTIVPFQYGYIMGYEYAGHTGERGIIAIKVIEKKALVTIYDNDGQMIIDKLTATPKRYQRPIAELRKMRHAIESTCQLIRRGRKFGIICDLRYDLNPAYFSSYLKMKFDKIKDNSIVLVAEPSLSYKDAVALIRKIDDEAILKDKAFLLATQMLIYTLRKSPCPDEDTLWKNFPEEKRAAVLELMIKHDLPIPEKLQ